MAQITSTLREAQDQNNALLAELRQTDFAPSSLQQNTSYIHDLKSQLKSTEKELARLHTITEDERKDHVKYRDSNVKRYLHKLGGSKGQEKFTSRAEKEEKEFMEAWQKERSAIEQRDELKHALSQAESHHSDLEKDTQRHDKAQTELDKLYNSIFNGPTPDVPGEDQLEEAVKQNGAHHGQMNQAATAEKKALEVLTRADKSLRQAAEDVQTALRRSQRDMFGGGTFTDMMEREALSQAQNNVNATLRHMAEARRIQPQIQELSAINIDQGHMLSDVLFDNIFTDMAQHDRIKASERDIAQAVQQLQGQLQEQQGRVGQAERRLKEAKDGLEGDRKELQRIRVEAFERLAGGESAPPPYQA